MGSIKTIYLHIGLCKTGTLSIQRFLSLNSTQLLRIGVHYIKADNRGNGHPNLAKSFIVDWPGFKMTHGNLEEARSLVLKEIVNSCYDTFLISSENFMLACPKSVYEYFSAIPNVTIKIVLFVRSQDELAESSYNQLVKLNKEHRTFFEFFNYTQKLGWYDFYSLAEKWAMYFDESNIIARVFDAKAVDSINKLLTAINISPEHYTSFDFNIDQENKSIGYFALMAIRNLDSTQNETKKWPRQLYHQLKRLFKNHSGQLHERNKLVKQSAQKDVPALMFDAIEGENIRLLYKSANEHFSKKYLGVEMNDLNGRKYTATERDLIRNKIQIILRS
jgi:hypothetical protein